MRELMPKECFISYQSTIRRLAKVNQRITELEQLKVVQEYVRLEKERAQLYGNLEKIHTELQKWDEQETKAR